MTQYLSTCILNSIEDIWREYTNYEIHVEEALTFSTRIVNQGDLNFVSVEQTPTGKAQGKHTICSHFVFSIKILRNLHA